MEVLLQRRGAHINESMARLRRDNGVLRCTAGLKSGDSDVLSQNATAIIFGLQRRAARAFNLPMLALAL